MSILEVCDAAGITRSHLANVLNGQKSLSPQKIRALAEVTGVPISELLDAAGYIDSKSAIDEAVRASLPMGTVTVVTDPKFLDSAIFLWLFKSNALTSLGIEWEIRQVPWKGVPWLVQKTDMSLGFYNRKTATAVTEGLVAAPRFWADLAVYEGYALMARKDDATGLPNEPSIAESLEYLRRLLATNDRPVVLAIDKVTFTRFKTPLAKDLPWERFQVVTEFDADAALELFLNKHGDLFVGGLPQRFKAQHSGQCVPILSISNDPWLFSLNSLICSETMFRNGQGLMALITAVWFQVCRELRADAAFRTKMFGELTDMLANELRVTDHSITEDLVHSVFKAEDPSVLEFFPRRPAGVITRVWQKITNCIAASVEHEWNPEQTALALKWISEETIGPDETESFLLNNDSD